MNDFTKDRILMITKKMMSYNIAKVFCIPIDITLDDFIEYGRRVKEPMDLLTIKERIESDYYPSYDKWKHDMNLVFDNAIRFYGKISTITLLAMQMKIWFNNLLEKYPPTADKWEESVEKNAISLVKALSECKCTKHSFTTKIQQIVNPKQTGVEEYMPSPIQDDYSAPAPSAPQPKKNTRKDDTSNTAPKRVREPKTSTVVSDYDKIKIARAINDLTEENQITAVLTLIQKKEPGLGIDEESTVSMNQLKPATLNALKQLLQTL